MQEKPATIEPWVDGAKPPSKGADALQMRPESGTFVREGATFAGAPYISARGLGLKTYAGYAYREVDVDVHKGELVAVRGRNGSGKTALLLTLAGRMKQTEGALNVGEFELPRQRSKAERHVGLGLFSGLNDLQDSLTAAYALGAEFELYGRKPRREAVTDYLRQGQPGGVGDGGGEDLPPQKPAHAGIALGVVGEPESGGGGERGGELTMSQSEALVDLLLDAARTRNVAVVVGVVERDLAAMAAATVYLSKDGE